MQQRTAQHQNNPPPSEPNSKQKPFAESRSSNGTRSSPSNPTANKNPLQEVKTVTEHNLPLRTQQQNLTLPESQNTRTIPSFELKVKPNPFRESKQVAHISPMQRCQYRPPSQQCHRSCHRDSPYSNVNGPSLAQVDHSGLCLSMTIISGSFPRAAVSQSAAAWT